MVYSFNRCLGETGDFLSELQAHRYGIRMALKVVPLAAAIMHCLGRVTIACLRSDLLSITFPEIAVLETEPFSATHTV